MDKAEFIKQIMELYPDTFNPERKKQYQGWINRYRNAINENWDFDKLMYYFDTQYKSTVTPPHPSFFYEYRKEVRKEVKNNEDKMVLTPEEKAEAEEARKKFMEGYRKIMKERKGNGLF